MNLTLTTFARKGTRRLCLRTALLVLALSVVKSVRCQEVLAPPSIDYQQRLPTFQPWGTNQASAGPPMINAPSEVVPDFLDWGSVRAHPHMLYRLSYGDGLPSAPGEHNKTMINEIDPGITFDLGQHWNLDYTPSLKYYSNSKFRDTLDHFVSFNGATTYESWMFSLLQTYSSSSPILVETAGQTDQETFLTGLNAAWHMNSKLSLELGFNQDFRFVGESSATNQLVNSMTWSTMNWLNYQVMPRVGFAVGLGGGYDDVSAGTDMTYEQVQGRITWVAATKLSLTVSGGMEDRQFRTSGAPNLINPIFNMTLAYQLFEPTTLTFNLVRTVDASYFQDQVTESVDFNGGIRQRLFGKVYFDLSGGYRETTYKATINGGFFIATLNRRDNYAYVSARLSASILKRGTISVFFQQSDDHSNTSAYTYSSSQVGLELGYRL